MNENIYKDHFTEENKNKYFTRDDMCRFAYFYYETNGRGQKMKDIDTLNTWIELHYGG